MKKQPTSFKDFCDSNKLDEFALIFGNGLPRSYPKEAQNSKEVRGGFELSKKEYNGIWRSVNKRIKLYISKIQTKKGKIIICPEKILNYIRILYDMQIFIKYQRKQEHLTQYTFVRPTSFLNRFGAVYTLNYDNFSYASIFDKVRSAKNSNFDDGFEATPININKMIGHLEDPRDGKKPFFFLHGAFIIFQNKDGNYQKKRAKEVIPTYDDIDKNLEEYLNGNIDIQDPVIIFSGRPCYKNAALLDEPYLEYCKIRLSKEKKIFTFGCSFELDSHILDAIFEPLENKAEKKEIYFGFYSADDKERIEEYIGKNKKMDGNITYVYVDVSDVVSVNDIVWGQR